MSNNQVSKMQQRVNNAAAGIENIPLDSAMEKANNNFWDEANTHFYNCMAAVNQVEGTLCKELIMFSQTPDLLKYVTDQQKLANNIQILNKDLKEHIERLNGIHIKHQNKTGGTKTPDEHMFLLKINGEYVEALDIYNANIIPSVSTILEQIGAAQALVDEVTKDKKIQELQDPNIVSDIEIKEKV